MRPARRLGAALGDSSGQDYASNRSARLAAAGALLIRHPRERLDGALVYMVTDEILGSQALTMGGLRKVADQLIARAYARRQRTAASRAATGSGAEARSWERARTALERAIQRHGREGRAAALRELAAHDELLVQVVDRRYAELWGELVQQPNDQREEHVGCARPPRMAALRRPRVERIQRRSLRQSV